MPTGPLKAYYDGGCRVCKREIAFYRLQPDMGAIEWVDAHASNPYLHVRRADVRLLSGASAFAGMWRLMLRFKWLGLLLGVPPFNSRAELGYRGFLIARRLWR